jgi:hypothetical protein
MIYKIKQIIDMFFAQRKLYKRATTENNWVACHKCIYRDECETREMRYGCSMGDEE